MSADCRDAAIAAAQQCLRVFPVVPRGKKPLRKGWQRSATSDLEVVAVTWAKAPDANIGVACGNGLLVVDTDSAEADAAVKEWMPPTPTVRTSAGRHYYLAGSGSGRSALLPSVDVLGAGRYVVGAGSVHRSGARYEWEVALSDLPLAPAPGELLALLSTSQKPLPNALPNRIERGTRNDTLFRIACSLRGRFGLTYVELLPAVLALNHERCRPPLDRREVENLARSAAAFEAAPQWAVDPIRFAKDPSLRAKERLLLVAIARYANSEGIAWPGVRLLREDTGLATDTIAHATDALVAAGRIAIEKRRGKSNCYRILDWPNRVVAPGEGGLGSSVLHARTVRCAAPKSAVRLP